MSVWDGVDRTSFYRNLKTLCSKGKHQSSSQCSARLLPHLLNEAEDEGGSVGLSAKVECQLADDFAFLASWSTLPRHVAAAAVQQKSEPRRVGVVVAANQGINPRVREAFETILRGLERRARRELSRDETQRHCQTAVVSLHRDRIFGRLGPRKKSAKTQGPQWSAVDIGGRLASLVRQLEDKPAAKTLIKQLNDVTGAIKTAQAAPCGSVDELAGLHRILESAFEVVKGDESLVTRLKTLGIQSVNEQNKEIRQLHALATYHRICTYLAKISGGQYREWFRSIELEVLEAPPPSHWKGHKAFVHAEIQLLVHFDLHPQQRPRFIGASKKPCFLCYCFIRAHATYSIRASHGEVYEQWTVPDGVACSAPARKRLSAALRRTSSDVQAVSKTAIPKGPYLNPLQTVSKDLWNVSQSSAASDAAASRLVVASSSRGARSPEPVEISEVDTGGSSSDDLVSMLPSSSDADSEIDVVVLQTASSVSVAESTAPATIPSRVLSPRHAAEFHTREMSLFIELEGSEDSGRDVDGAAKRFPRASCRVSHVRAGCSASILGATEATDRVSVNDLVDGEVVVVERGVDSEEAVRVILEAAAHHHVLELVWLEA